MFLLALKISGFIYIIYNFQSTKALNDLKVRKTYNYSNTWKLYNLCCGGMPMARGSDLKMIFTVWKKSIGYFCEYICKLFNGFQWNFYRILSF